VSLRVDYDERAIDQAAAFLDDPQGMSADLDAIDRLADDPARLGRSHTDRPICGGFANTPYSGRAVTSVPAIPYITSADMNRKWTSTLANPVAEPPPTLHRTGNVRLAARVARQQQPSGSAEMSTLHAQIYNACSRSLILPTIATEPFPSLWSELRSRSGRRRVRDRRLWPNSSLRPLPALESQRPHLARAAP
jgi:hypothetical protein